MYRREIITQVLLQALGMDAWVAGLPLSLGLAFPSRGLAESKGKEMSCGVWGLLGLAGWRTANIHV